MLCLAQVGFQQVPVKNKSHMAVSQELPPRVTGKADMPVDRCATQCGRDTHWAFWDAGRGWAASQGEAVPEEVKLELF